MYTLVMDHTGCCCVVLIHVRSRGNAILFILSRCFDRKIFQMTKEQNVFENPFREGGEISRDADDIVDAFKRGKLSEISNSSEAAAKDCDDDDDNRESLVKPIERKNGVLVVDSNKEKKPEKEVPEEKNLKKYYCCSVL